jgi:hypothetical protein
VCFYVGLLALLERGEGVVRGMAGSEDSIESSMSGRYSAMVEARLFGDLSHQNGMGINVIPIC